MFKVYFLIKIVIVIIAVIIIAYSILRSFEYRLGDFIRQAGGFDNIIWRKTYAIMQNQNSIIRQYSKKTDKPLHITVLNDIVDDLNHKHHICPVTCVFHVRLGDVIDNHHLSVEEFLSGNYEEEKNYGDSIKNSNHRWQGGICNSSTCNSYGYVKPLSFFDDAISKLPRSVNDILIVSGSHISTKNPEKSQLYLSKLKRFLEKRGYKVLIKWNEDPDLDFVRISTANYIITTGGGFSALAGVVAKERGGVVVA